MQYFIESVFSGSGNQNKNKQMDLYQAKKLLQSWENHQQSNVATHWIKDDICK